MSKGDLQKRNAAWKEKRSKLKNPNYTVSPVRLSVRNLPLDMDEKHLKTMFLTAAVEYISEHADVLDVDGLQNEKGAKARPVIKQVISRFVSRKLKIRTEFTATCLVVGQSSPG